MTGLPSAFAMFPGNYRWSAAALNLLATAPYGGADMGEVYRLRLLLEHAEAGDDDAWFTAAVTLADAVKARADASDAAGHPVSAASFNLRACNYYQMGERFRTPKDAVALNAYRTGVDCFHRFAALSGQGIEVVDVPSAIGDIPAYFVPVPNSAGRTASAIYFGGLDLTKEIQFMRGVPDLIRRGISVLVVDGPGTGEAIRFRGQYLRPDYEVAGSACLDYLAERSDVDPARIGIVALSLGGYYAPRCAAMDTRFAACVAWGAIWDYHAVWERRIAANFKAAASVPGHHILWVLDVETPEQALAKLEPFRLDGVVQRMRCPFLVLHGENDEQVPLSDAEKLYAAAGSADKSLRVFTAQEGGAQHCQRDYLTLGVATMWDWLEDKLSA